MKSKSLWACPTCGRQFAKPKQSHSCQSRSVDDHFHDRDPRLRAMFDALVRGVQKTGPVRVDAVASTIHLISQHAFAGIAVRRDYFNLEFLASGEIESPRIFRSDRLGARRVAHHVRIATPADLDSQIFRWLAAAQALQSAKPSRS